jgi:hypothetical protein
MSDNEYIQRCIRRGNRRIGRLFQRLSHGMGCIPYGGFGLPSTLALVLLDKVPVSTAFPSCFVPGWALSIMA